MEKSWRISRFWLAFFLVAIILLPAISGVAPLARAPGTAERVLRYPSGPPLTLDPSAPQDIGDVELINLYLAGLVRQGTDGAAIPDLAQSWTVSADGLTYVFKLREGIVWSDGQPVTAAQFRDGILRTLDPAIGSPLSVYFSIISTIEATSTDTLTVTLKAPAAYFISLVSLSAAYPFRADNAPLYDTTPPQPPPCPSQPCAAPATRLKAAGAYTISNLEVNEVDGSGKMVFMRNPLFYDKRNVFFDRIELTFYPAGTLFAKVLPSYLDGTFDVIGVPGINLSDSDPTNSSRTLRDRPDFRILPDNGVSYIAPLHTTPPMNVQLVRKAFSAATDRRSFVEKILGSVGVPATSVTPPGNFGNVAGQGIGQDFDPKHAKNWLAEAGFPDGAGLPPIRFRYIGQRIAGSETPERPYGLPDMRFPRNIAAKFIQDNWEQVLGVTVVLEPIPGPRAVPKFLASLAADPPHFFRQAWIMDYRDAQNSMHDLFYPDSLFHRQAFDDQQYRQFVDRAAVETDPGKRLFLYDKAERIFCEEQDHVIPLFYFAEADLVKGGLVMPDLFNARTWLQAF